MGYVTEEERTRVINLYQKAQLPTEIPDYIDREALVKKLYTDKKLRMENYVLLFKMESELLLSSRREFMQHRLKKV